MFISRRGAIHKVCAYAVSGEVDRTLPPFYL